MLFDLVLTKFFKSELFSCLPKVDHVIKSSKEPIEQQQRVHSFRKYFICSVEFIVKVNGYLCVQNFLGGGGMFE